MQRSIALKVGVLVFLGHLRANVIAYIIGIAASLILLLLTAWAYTELRWYIAVGYEDVIITVFTTQMAMGLIPFFAMTFLVASNMLLAKNLAPLDRIISADERRIDRWRRAVNPVTRPLILVIAQICGLAVALRSYPQWETFLLWWYGGKWGRTDPYFGYDLGYFMFRLAFYTLVQRWLFIGLLVTLILSALTSYLFGGLRPQAPGAKVPMQVNVHLSALMLALMALLGWGLLLDLQLLSYSERGVITGLGYTDANASLVAYRFVATGVVIGFILLQINIRKPGWVLPTVAVVWLFLIGLAAVRFYPNIYQFLIVEPQELERETPYITDHLKFTRYGFGLEDVDRHLLPGDPEAATAALRKNRNLIANLRLWDPDTLRIDFRELQALRSYYDFKDVAVDRYKIDGEVRPVMLGAREVDVEKALDHGGHWEDDHFIYTHGEGLVAASVCEKTEGGLPRFLARDLPVTGVDALRVDNPRIYYGEASPTYSIVRSTAIELKRPRHGAGFRVEEYGGTGGVQMDGLIDRIAFALRFWSPRLALTRLLDDQTRILFHRRVRERVARVAPYLKVDRDPYPVIDKGRIKWIVDVYTTSDMMPYSKRVNLDDLTQLQQPKQDTGGIIPREFTHTEAGLSGTVNYIRNSAKAVVDAYDGAVTFYVVDPSDPLLKAWRQVFPKSFKPVDAADPNLRAHFRYPQDLFQIQAVIWQDYHMRAPESFYTQEARWRIPSDASFISFRRERQPGIDENQRRVDLRPYWLYTRLPGSEAKDFILAQPFVPGGRNFLAGYLVGHSDGARYGRLSSYAFPPTTTVIGPAQAQARIDQDARISAWITLRMQSGSRVSRGRLITLPLGKAVIYVQPLFVQADKSSVSALLGAQLSSIPELKKVVVVAGERVVMRDTIKDAIDAIVGEAPRRQMPRGTEPDDGSPPVPKDTGGAGHSS